MVFGICVTRVIGFFMGFVKDVGLWKAGKSAGSRTSGKQSVAGESTDRFEEIVERNQDD
jgi:hypothetical protein